VRVGQRCRLEAVKNKCGGAPYASTDINLMYATGCDKVVDVVDYAVHLGIVESGAWYTFKGERFRKNRLTEPDMFDTLRLEIGKTLEARRKENAEADDSRRIKTDS
jgi:hypothetical protein